MSGTVSTYLLHAGINVLTLPPLQPGNLCVAISSPDLNITGGMIYLSWRSTNPVASPDAVALPEFPIILTDPSVATATTIYLVGATGATVYVEWGAGDGRVRPGNENE